MTNRRDFVLSGTAAAVASSVVASFSEAAEEKLVLNEGDVILFQGDSITDAGRDKKRQVPNHPRSLGTGYPAHVAGGVLIDQPKLGLQIHNRGISGNKVPDLDARWQVDAIDLKPNVLSILIGVNDIWHKLNGRYDGTPEVYRDGLATLLKRTREALPETKLVICEPFVLKCGAVTDDWFPEFETRRGYAREVADAADTIWVPFQEMFNQAVDGGTAPEFWAADGVHPTVAGHALMAKTWRGVVGI